MAVNSELNFFAWFGRRRADLVTKERRRLRDAATEYVHNERSDYERYSAFTMVTGQPADAAFGINRYLGRRPGRPQLLEGE